MGSDLDGYLFLLDSDGGSELAESDDEILFEKQDPLLAYMLPRDGEYYLKFHAWDHPMGTGEYSLKLINDDQNPSITLENPIEGASIPIGDVTLSALATDAQSGIQYVQFSYHDSNWETGKWVEIGTDFDVLDGWSTIFDTTSLTDGETISVYAAAYDWGGNWDHDAAWHVKVDAQPLALKLWELPDQTQSTALHLQWSVTGGGSETAAVNVQQKVNNGSWSDLLTDTDLVEYWYIGEAGNSYAFQITTKDYAGNEVTGQTNTTIPAASSLCSQPDAWDVNASINDNSYTKATAISINDASQLHNFCNPVATDYLNDEDWLSFSAEKGQIYVLIARPSGDRSAAVTTRFYGSNGTTLLAEEEAATFGRSTELYWKATEDGIVYVQLLHNNGNVAGNGVSYVVHLSDGSIYMPIVTK